MQMYSTCQCDKFLVQRVTVDIGSDVSFFFFFVANKLFVFVSELIALGKNKVSLNCFERVSVVL